MRIVIVFSSPSPGTGEYNNVWDNCPQRQEIAPGKLVIKGNDWKIYIFDGLERRYFNGSWVYERLSCEAADIMQQHGDSLFAILLHGTDKELTTLKNSLQTLDASEIFYKWYTSSKGAFFKKYIKPFVSDSPNNAFENLWTKLEIKTQADLERKDLMGELRFHSHKFSNIPRFMKIIADDAKEDINILLEFKKFDIEDLLERYAQIEPELMKLKINGVDRVHSTMEEVIEMIRDIQKENISPDHALGLAYQCIEKTESVCNTFKKTLENSDD